MLLLLLLQRCPTCVSGTSDHSRPERESGVGGGNRRTSLPRFSLRFFFFGVIWMGSVFWKGRQKKAEGSRGRGATGSSQSPLPHTDWRQRRPPEYLLLSFVFCSFSSSLRCWEVLYLFICSLSRSSVSSSISPFTWSTISAVHEPDEEGERGAESQREEKRGGGIFWGPFYSLFFPPHPLFIHPPHPIHRYLPPLCSPRSPPPPPPSAHQPLPNFFFSHSTCVFTDLL